MTTDYLADYAVFEAMPDTATKAEIRAAIDADRAERAARRCALEWWDPDVQAVVQCVHTTSPEHEHQSERERDEARA